MCNPSKNNALFGVVPKMIQQDYEAVSFDAS